MRLPDFFIVGAAKAGTTSVHEVLTRHPDVFLPQQKEPEFFCRDDLYGEGVDAYLQRHFTGSDQAKRVGEASTMYSMAPVFPDTATRIAAHCPDAQLIYMMRHPVKRAFSFYQQILKNYQNGTGDLTVHRSLEDFVYPERHAKAAPRDKFFAPFDAHLPDVPDLMLVGSDYVTQIQAYLAHFPRDRMLFLKFEDYARDPSAVLRQITDFLGLDPVPSDILESDAARTNIARDHFQGWGEAQTVADFGEKAGPLWSLRKALPQGLRQSLRGALLGKLQPKAEDFMPDGMEPETRAMLEARYAPQIPHLAELTGLDFSEWTFETR